MKTLLIIAASAMSASLLVPTLAEARTFDFEPLSQVVRYDDLNLATKKGQATLDRRIAHAARNVCRAHERPVNLAVNACIQQVKGQARREAQIAIQRFVNQARPA